MKTSIMLILAAGGLLVAGYCTTAAETEVNAVLVIPCDGTPREQAFLREQTNTWVFGQNAVFARTLSPLSPVGGKLVYRVPVGNAKLVRLSIQQMSLVPFRLDFSADGAHWETLNTPIGNPPKSTSTIDFTDAQAAEAHASGDAWVRIRPALESTSDALQLQYVRVEARGTSFPPEFVRLNWKGQIAAMAIGPMMMLVGIVPICLVSWRWHVKARVWAAGAALWALSVTLKLMFAAVSVELVSDGLRAVLPRSWADLIWWSYTGLLTGIFECGIFLVVMRKIRRKTWTWHEALGLGLGFGAIEAVAVGVTAIFSLPFGGNAACLIGWSDALAPVFERLATLVFHTAAVVMILYAVINGKWQWFALSFIYKSAIDAVDAWLVLSGTSLISFAWRMELICFAPFVVPGLLALFYLGRKWKEPATKPATVPLTVV